MLVDSDERHLYSSATLLHTHILAAQDKHFLISHRVAQVTWLCFGMFEWKPRLNAWHRTCAVQLNVFGLGYSSSRPSDGESFDHKDRTPDAREVGAGTVALIKFLIDEISQKVGPNSTATNLDSAAREIDLIP